MSIASFEQDLVNKLSYKASSKISTDAVLFKAFKFFDLNGEGYVPKNQFFRTMAKIGVIIDNPQQMDQVFTYYDKQKQGKIFYADFIQSILFRNASQQPASKSRALTSSSYSQSSAQSVKQHKVEKVQIKSVARQKQTPQQISQFVRQKLREEGVTGLLRLAVNMKNLDKQRTHHLTLPKYQLIFSYLSLEQIKTFFKSFGKSKSGEVNYAEVAYHIRGKETAEVQQFLTELFNRFDIHNEGEISIEEFIEKLYGSKPEQENIRQAISLYCKFQGIDDGIFTLDDFLDFFGFLQFNFDTDKQFQRYVREGREQRSERSVASSRSSRRQFQTENKSIYQKMKQNPHNADFRKNKEKAVEQHYEHYQQDNRSSDNLSQDLSSQDKMSKRSVRSKASSQLTSTPSIKNIIDRVKSSLVNKGTMRFLLFEKALRGVDFDQDSYINLPELKKVIKDLRIGISDVEAQILFQNFDMNGVGLMSYPELVFEVRGDTPEHRNKLISRIWDRVKESDNATSFSKLRSIFQPRAHPDLKIAKRHEEDIYKQFVDTLLLIQDLNGTRSEQVDKDTFLEYLQNVSASMIDDKFFDVAMIGLWKLSNETKIQEQYAGSRKKFQTGKKAYLQDFHKSTLVGGSSSDHAPFGTFKGPVNYTTQHRAAYEI